MKSDLSIQGGCSLQSQLETLAIDKIVVHIVH